MFINNTNAIVLFDATNTYSGQITIQNGIARLNGSGDTFGSSGQDIRIHSTGTLDLNGVSTTIGSVAEYETSNSGVITLGSGTLTISGANKGTLFQNSISGTGGVTMAGSGNTTLGLFGTQSYTGTTTITGGTLTTSVALSTPNISISGGRFALTQGGTAASANITVSSSGNFDVSEINNGTISLAASKILTATTGTLTTAASKNFSLGSGSMVINSYGGNASALTLAGGGGEFQLASRGITVNTSSALGAGTYKLIAKSGSANVTGTPGTLTLGGSQLAAGTSGALSVSSGELILAVTVNPPVVTGATYAGTVGTAFSQTVSATNSPTSYALASGTLPAGLSLNTSTGVISGTPTAAASGTTVTITATNAGGTSSAVTFTFNIAKGASTISVTGSTSFAYTGSPQGPDGHSKTGSTGAVTFSYSGTGGTSYSASATKPTNVGSYLATATVATDSNYEAQTSATYAFSITQASQSITFGALAAKTYGDAAFALTATASSSLSVSYTSSNTSVATISGSTLTIVAAGSTTITASQAGNTNYSAAANATQSLTVATKSLTGSFTASNKVYNGTTAATVATRAVTGKVGSDDVNHTGGTATFSTAAVGNGITVTLAGATLTGLKAANYSLASVSTTTANITAAALSITANGESKTFGNTVSSGSGKTAFTSSGLQNSETIGSVTLTYSGGTASDAAAGTYTITPSAATAGNFTASNYSITYNTGTLTVTAIAPTVTTGTSGSVTVTGAVITGSNVTSAGGGTISQRGVVYGTSASPALGGGNTTVADGSTTTGSFNSTLTGLTGGTTYHVRAFVTTGHSTAYGSSISFTTEADVPAKVSLSRAHTPGATSFTAAWSDVANETSYHLEHAANSAFTSSTLVTDIAANATSHSLTGLTANSTYFVRVRGASAGGNGTWSDTQVNQLRTLPAGSTAYLSVAGTGSAETVAGVFGATNQAGLASGANDSASTVVMLLNDAGSTAHTVFYSSSANQWRGVGTGDTDRATEAMASGKAFMLKNNTGSANHILIVAEPRTAPVTVSVNATAGQVNLLTPAKSTSTALDALDLRSTGAADSATRIKEASGANTSDLIMIPQANGRLRGYFHDGTVWRSAGGNEVSDPSAITVPAGGAFFIRKAPGSNFDSWTLPEE